jgi:hypothetical protein
MIKLYLYLFMAMVCAVVGVIAVIIEEYAYAAFLELCAAIMFTLVYQTLKNQ